MGNDWEKRWRYGGVQKAFFPASLSAQPGASAPSSVNDTYRCWQTQTSGQPIRLADQQGNEDDIVACGPGTRVKRAPEGRKRVIGITQFILRVWFALWHGNRRNLEVCESKEGVGNIAQYGKMAVQLY